MTEDEAKTKWCPAARVVTASNKQVFSAGNRAAIMPDERKPDAIEVNENPDHSRCIASACMAWRTLTRKEMRYRDGHVVQPGEVYLHGNATEEQVPDGGYCGLAGRE